MSGKSTPYSIQYHSKRSSINEVNGVLELIKIQEEKTAMVISCAKAKAASEKAEATALAKKAEAVAEAEVAMKIAAEGRLAQVEAEAKQKEIELNKRLLEDWLSSFSKGSSRNSSRSRRSILQPLPTQEAVEKWMQVRIKLPMLIKM